MITPLKLELTNFCQYRKTSIDFHPGITGYVGHNGVGKTNLIDTGLFFAITGETGAFNKDELIRHGSEKGHTCFTFEHNGLTYTLTRNLRSSGVKLEWQSSPQEKPQEEKKPAIINQMVEEMVGMPSEIMREVCWGAQEGLVAVLKMTHSKRLEFFQRLCNVTKTEAWRSVLQERMSKLPVYEDRSIELSSLCQQLSELNIKQLNDSVRLNTLAANGKSPDQFSQRLADIARKLGLQTAAMYLQKKGSAEAAVNSSKTSLIRVRADLAALQGTVGIPSIHPHAEEWNRRFLRAVELTAELDKLQMEVIEVPAATEAPSSAEADSLKHQAAELLPEYKLALSKVCPTCKRPYDVKNPQEIIDQFSRITKQADEASYLYTVALTAYQTRERQITAAMSRKQTHENRIVAVANELNQIVSAEPCIPSDFTPDSYQQQKQQLNEYRSKEQQRSALLQKIAQLESAITEQTKALEKVSQEPYLTDADKTLLVAEQEQIRKATEDFRNLEITIKTDEATANVLQERLKQIEISEAKRKKVEAVLASLTKVRDRLHKDMLPKIVMSKMLNGLNAYLEYYLSRFEAPFTAQIDADFDFKVTFPDGKVMPGRSLSGGEKVTLIFAFKFAQSELFGRNIPLMVLDEPTTWLDEKNVGRMAELFKLARGFAERNCYVIVATHEPQILSSMSRVVELGEGKND